MAIYTGSKPVMGAVAPQGAIDEDWVRTEALITGQQVIDRFLKGIPLVSGVPDPVTKKLVRFTPEDISEKIVDAIADLEEEVGIYIFPVQLRKRFEFDLNEFRSYGYFKIPDRPVASVESLRIESSSGTNFFEMPKEWIETGHLGRWGQINILPLSPGTFGSTSPMTGGPAAMVVLNALSASSVIPAYWTCDYTVGFPDGKIPRTVNNLIGIETAMEILSMIAATFAQRTSSSLGIDSLSQSVSGPGPQLYETRRNELAEKKKTKVKKLKKLFGTKIIVGSL